MDGTYEWRWCKECGMRIFKDEIECDTIKTVDGELYCIDCADDVEQMSNKLNNKMNEGENNDY